MLGAAVLAGGAGFGRDGVSFAVGVGLLGTARCAPTGVLGVGDRCLSRVMINIMPHCGGDVQVTHIPMTQCTLDI